MAKPLSCACFTITEPSSAECAGRFPSADSWHLPGHPARSGRRSLFLDSICFCRVGAGIVVQLIALGLKLLLQTLEFIILSFQFVLFGLQLFSQSFEVALASLCADTRACSMLMVPIFEPAAPVAMGGWCSEAAAKWPACGGQRRCWFGRRRRSLRKPQWPGKNAEACLSSDRLNSLEHDYGKLGSAQPDSGNKLRFTLFQATLGRRTGLASITRRGCGRVVHPWSAFLQWCWIRSHYREHDRGRVKLPRVTVRLSLNLFSQEDVIPKRAYFSRVRDLP